jgi:hypothetical protein
MINTKVDKGKTMSATESYPKPPNSWHNWIITLAIIFLSFSGVTLSLICIYSMPDRTVRPLIGSAFYMCGAVAVVFFLILRWRKDIEITKASLSNDNHESIRVIIKEPISDKIIKWIVMVYVFFFAMGGLAIALICIYALPDKTVQPKTGIVYFIAGAISLASFVFVVWKKWSMEQERS